MGVLQILTDAHQRLVQSETDFDADYCEVEGIWQSQRDPVLAIADHALEDEAGNEEADASDANHPQQIKIAFDRDHAQNSNQTQQDARARRRSSRWRGSR